MFAGAFRTNGLLLFTSRSHRIWPQARRKIAGRGTQRNPCSEPSLPGLKAPGALKRSLCPQLGSHKSSDQDALVIGRDPFSGISPKERWSRIAMDNLYTLQTGSEIRFKLEQYLLSLKFTEERLQRINKQILRFCTQNPEIWRCMGLLCSIPGIGKVVAVHLLARIGDWRNLTNSRQIAALLGMIPVEDST